MSVRCSRPLLVGSGPEVEDLKHVAGGRYRVLDGKAGH